MGGPIFNSNKLLRPGVPGSNPIAAPKSYEVYPSTSGLLPFNKPETVLWTIANNYYYHYDLIAVNLFAQKVENSHIFFNVSYA